MTDDWKEENFLWFFRSDEEPMKPNAEKEQWTQYEQSNEIEAAYEDYKSYKNTGSASKFVKFPLEGTEYLIDFENNVQRTNDCSKQRMIGRFEGDKASDKQLANTLTYDKYRWYFETEPGHWAPYRVDDNDKIEAEYFKHIMSKGPSTYKGSYFTMDFEKMKERNQTEQEPKNVKRDIACPENITRANYYNTSIKPQNTNGLATLTMETINNVKKDFCLNIKNILPGDLHKIGEKSVKYFIDSESNVILYMCNGDVSASDQDIVKELVELGYNEICQIKTEKEGEVLEIKIDKLSPKHIKKIFKYNWYKQHTETNNNFWKQLNTEESLEAENAFKTNFLLFGDKKPELCDKTYNKTIFDFRDANNYTCEKLDNKYNIMRYYIKNWTPDNYHHVRVPQEVYSLVEQEIKQKGCSIMTKANKFGPKNFPELIETIRNELRNEARILNSIEMFNSYDQEYIGNISYKNFLETIIKMYTE